MAAVPTVATARARRQHYRHNMLTGFDAPAELYYAYWGEYFHGDLEPRARGLVAFTRKVPSSARECDLQTAAFSQLKEGPCVISNQLPHTSAPTRKAEARVGRVRGSRIGCCSWVCRLASRDPAMAGCPGSGGCC